MKKLSILLIAFAVTAGSASAQNSTTKPSSRWGFGVLAGINQSFPHINSAFPARISAKTGWLAGVDASYQIGNRSSVHIQPSLMHFSNAKDADIFRNPNFELTTLKIPVLYRHHLLPAYKSLFVEVGGAYNQIVSSNYREQLPFLVHPPIYSSSLSPTTASSASIMGGVGVEIPFQKVTIPITLRYEQYVSSHVFPGNYDQSPRTLVSFQNVSLITGVNF